MCGCVVCYSQQGRQPKRGSEKNEIQSDTKGGAFYVRSAGGARPSPPDQQGDGKDDCKGITGHASAYTKAKGVIGMTNIEKLARLIVKTGNADKIMAALEVAVKVSGKPYHVGSESSELRIREVCTGSDPSGLYQQAG